MRRSALQGGNGSQPAWSPPLFQLPPLPLEAVVNHAERRERRRLSQRQFALQMAGLENLDQEISNGDVQRRP